MCSSGEVCSQRRRRPGAPPDSSQKGSRCRSTTVSGERIGVSTSRNPRSWKSRGAAATGPPADANCANWRRDESRLHRARGGGRTISSSPPRSLLDAFEILAGPRVDLNQLADFDERGAGEFGPGLDLARLRDVRGRVAAGARLAVFDLQHDVVRRRDRDRPAVEQHHAAIHAFLEVHPGVAHLVGWSARAARSFRCP